MPATLFTNGTILPMDGATRPEVVVVEDGRIAAVGDRELRAAFPDALIEDLAGRTLLPGFIDAHNHLCLAALHPRYADLRDIASLDDMATALREQSIREPAAEWVRGAGWDETRCGFTPTRDELDAIGLDRPVLVGHYSYHMGVACSRGLDRLGIGAATANPPGGEITRDARGRATGRLMERAWSAAHAASLQGYTDPDRWAEHIEARARVLLREGITAVHDAACPPEAEAVYAALVRTHRLPISVLAMPHPIGILSDPDPARLAGPPTGEGDEDLRVGPMKLFADGGVSPAVDVHLGGQPIQFGTRFPGLAEHAGLAVAHGFRIAIHAIGNAGLEAALDACADAYRGRPDDDARIRVEHATLASAAQARRLASMGGVAVVQPGFVDHMGRATAGFEPDDATWMPFATLAAAGVPLAASSDDPCGHHEPRLTSAFGTTRQPASGPPAEPAETLPYLDWLRAYTAGAAFAGAQEHERGRLRVGLRADLVVLDGALDAEHPPTVAQTWVAGTCAFRAS